MSRFYAGFSRVDITPKLGTPLSRYYQTRFASSVLDALEVNAMAVSCGEKRAIVFSVDHLGLVLAVQNEYRKHIAEVTGLPEDALYIHCIHIHNGPVVNLDGPDSMVEEYRLELKEKLAACAVAALADLKPAKPSFGVTHAPHISFIRRYLMKDAGHSRRTVHGHRIRRSLRKRYFYMKFYELMEILMVVAFGVSWPMNVVKSYKARSTKGKSLAFLLCIFPGYICGIIGKLCAPSFKWFVLFFYILNAIMVGLDLILYIRNYRLERLSKQKEASSVK